VNAKITLYSDARLIDKIKTYAKEHNTSVSKIVTHFFEQLTKQEEKHPIYSKNTSKLLGILRDKNVNESDYDAYLEKKYL
jgi:hypothetical protein